MITFQLVKLAKINSVKVISKQKIQGRFNRAIRQILANPVSKIIECLTGIRIIEAINEAIPRDRISFKQIIPHFTWSCHGRVATGSCCFPCRKSGGRGRSATPSWTNDAEVPPRRRKSPRNRSPTSSVCPSVWSSSSLPPRPSRIGCGSWSSDEVFVFYNPPRWMANPARPDSTVSCLPRSSRLISGWSIAPPRYAWTPWAILAAHFRAFERWLETRRMEREVEKYDDVRLEKFRRVYIHLEEDVERSSPRDNGSSFHRLYIE